MKTNNTPLNHGRTGHPYFLHSALPLNAFQSVRPRGEDKPSAVPARPHKGPEPTVLKGSYVRVLDRNGRLSAPLAPRIGTLAVEGQKAGQASADRRAALTKGGL